MIGKMALRDLAIAALAMMMWRWVAGASAGEGMLADLAGLVAGLGVGICGYLLHEWGHLSGALATRSAIEMPKTLKSVSLFSFDSKRNDKRQFLVMSFSGFAATALVVWGFYTWLPDGLLASRIARGVAMFGATLTVVIELPLVFWALLGRGLPPVETLAHAPLSGAADGNVISMDRRPAA